MKKNVPFNYLDKVWLFQDLSGTCNWTDFPPEDNCRYLMELTNKLLGLKVNVGIMGQKDYWKSIFGAKNACQ